MDKKLKRKLIGLAFGKTVNEFNRLNYNFV